MAAVKLQIVCLMKNWNFRCNPEVCVPLLQLANMDTVRRKLLPERSKD